MLKKISVEKLQVRMYVHKMRGPRIDSPFWDKSFMLEDQATLERVWASSITQVWIDIAKGLDVLTGDKASRLDINCDAIVEEAIQEFSEILAVTMDEEVGRATRIIDKSRQAVMLMFQEARMGNAVDTQNAQTLVEEIASSVMRNQGALISLARLKTADDYTYMHSVAVCALMIALATQLKLDDASIRQAGLAGLLHDLGKVTIKSEILNKPGKL